MGKSFLFGAALFVLARASSEVYPTKIEVMYPSRTGPEYKWFWLNNGSVLKSYDAAPAFCPTTPNCSGSRVPAYSVVPECEKCHGPWPAESGYTLTSEERRWKLNWGKPTDPERPLTENIYRQHFPDDYEYQSLLTSLVSWEAKWYSACGGNEVNI